MESNTAPKGSILIAHIGDVHLRDSQYATAQRSGDFFGALMRAINAAADANVDCIVCAGDNFDVSRPSAKTIGQLMQADALLKQRRLRMYTSTGNHDYSVPTWLETLFPLNVGKEYGIVPIDGATVECGGLKITGIPPYSAKAFMAREAEIDLLVRDSDVIVYHGFITGIVPMYTSDKTVLDVADLPVSMNTKAILLADIHKQGFVHRDRPGGGQVLIGYSGSLEMCNKSEAKDKSIPLIRVSPTAATIEGYIPLTIRPHVSMVVRNELDLDALIAEVQPVAAQHPVVLVEFARSMPQTVGRLHAILDPQRSVVRCYALPPEKTAAERVIDVEGEEMLDMQHFVSIRFSDEDESELGSVALALLVRGIADGNNIVSEFVERRLDAMKVRLED